jgi:hypothetical protein
MIEIQDSSCFSFYSLFWFIIFERNLKMGSSESRLFHCIILQVIVISRRIEIFYLKNVNYLVFPAIRERRWLAAIQHLWFQIDQIVLRLTSLSENLDNPVNGPRHSAIEIIMNYTQKTIGNEQKYLYVWNFRSWNSTIGSLFRPKSVSDLWMRQLC